MKVILKNSSAVFTTYKLSEKTKVLFDSPYFAGLTSKQKSYLDYFIVSMINNGIWQKLKRLYVPCFTTADGGFINIKPTIDNGQITIDTMKGNLGTDYYCSDYKGVTVNENVTADIFKDNYTVKNGYSMFGYASKGTVGTLYNSNNYRLYTKRYNLAGVQYKVEEAVTTLLITSSGSGVISAKKDFGAVSNLKEYKETQANCIPPNDYSASFYIGFEGGNPSSATSLIKYFGVGEGLTGDEVKFLAEKMNTLNTVL